MKVALDERHQKPFFNPPFRLIFLGLPSVFFATTEGPGDVKGDEMVQETCYVLLASDHLAHVNKESFCFQGFSAMLLLA